MTHTAAQRNQFTALQMQVCILLGWSEIQYCAFIEKCGKQYLQCCIPKDPQGIDMLVASKTFWSWWRTNWYQRDAVFAYQPGIDSVSLTACRLIYQYMHDPRTLAASIYPSGVVLRETYAVMIQDVIDNEKEGA